MKNWQNERLNEIRCIANVTIVAGCRRIVSQRLSELSVDKYFKSAFVSMRIESCASRATNDQISASFVHLESADPRLKTYLYPCFRKMHILVLVYLSR